MDDSKTECLSKCKKPSPKRSRSASYITKLSNTSNTFIPTTNQQNNIESNNISNEKEDLLNKNEEITKSSQLQQIETLVNCPESCEIPQTIDDIASLTINKLEENDRILMKQCKKVLKAIYIRICGTIENRMNELQFQQAIDMLQLLNNDNLLILRIWNLISQFEFEMNNSSNNSCDCNKNNNNENVNELNLDLLNDNKANTISLDTFRRYMTRIIFKIPITSQLDPKSDNIESNHDSSNLLSHELVNSMNELIEQIKIGTIISPIANQDNTINHSENHLSKSKPFLIHKPTKKQRSLSISISPNKCKLNNNNNNSNNNDDDDISDMAYDNYSANNVNSRTRSYSFSVSNKNNNNKLQKRYNLSKKYYFKQNKNNSNYNGNLNDDPSSNTAKLSKKSIKSDSIIYDRLYNDAFIRKTKQKKEYIKRMKIKKRNEFAQCTFHPTIDSISEIDEKYRKPIKSKTKTKTKTTKKHNTLNNNNQLNGHQCNNKCKNKQNGNHDSENENSHNETGMTQCEPFHFLTEKCRSTNCKNLNYQRKEDIEYEKYCTFKPNIKPHPLFYKNINYNNNTKRFNNKNMSDNGNNNNDKNKNNNNNRSKSCNKHKLKTAKYKNRQYTNQHNRNSYVQIHGSNSGDVVNANTNDNIQSSNNSKNKNFETNKQENNNNNNNINQIQQSLQQMILSSPQRLFQKAKDFISPTKQINNNKKISIDCTDNCIYNNKSQTSLQQKKKDMSQDGLKKIKVELMPDESNSKNMTVNDENCNQSNIAANENANQLKSVKSQSKNTKIDLTS